MDQKEEFDYEAMYEEDSEYNAEGDEHWSELMPAQHIEGQPAQHFGQSQAMQSHMMHGQTDPHEAMYGGYPAQYMMNNMMPVNYFEADPKSLVPNVPHHNISPDISLKNLPHRDIVPTITASKESSLPSINNMSGNPLYQTTQSWHGHEALSQNNYTEKIIPNNSCVVPTSNFSGSVSNSASFSNTGGPKISSDEKSELNSLLNQTNAAATNYSKDRSKDQTNQKNKFTSLTSKTKTAHYSPYPKMSQETPHRREKGTEKKSLTGTDPHQIMDRLTQARNELKNLRQSVRGLNAQHKTDVHRLEGLLQYSSPTTKPSEQCNASQKTAATENNPDDQSGGSQETKFNPLFQNWKPIGFMESSYMHKNGTPRQGCLVKESRGKIRILEALYTNPHHSLHGLDQHSHVWLVFAFDRNSADPSGNAHFKAKVAPPRFGGARLGVFATRSPHRPCPIGLTLAKLEAVEGSTVHVSGVDILYGTAILDIKPYIPDYDAPRGSDPEVTRESLMQSIREASQRVPNGLDGSDDKSGLGCSFLGQANTTGQTSGVKTDAVEMNVSSSITKREKTSSKGIVITKLAPSAEYEHLLTKVTGLATSSSSSARSQSAETKKLSTSEQLRNAERECDALGSLLSNGGSGAVKTAKWLQEANASPLELIFNPIAEKQLARIILCESERLSLRSLIGDTLRSDPRSVYRRQRCPDLLYRCHLAAVTVTAAFLDEEGAVEVLRIAPADQDRDEQEDAHMKGERDDEAVLFSGQTVGL